MEKSELIDYPAANIINQLDESQKIEPLKDYPIIRCKNCFEILNISLDLNKREIILKCEKEQNTEKIHFDKFLKDINIYNGLNYCQLCKEKNFSNKYYICKTCSNKILCQNCFKIHNKEDEIMAFKIDSSCKKHFSQYESFCPICKENKCAYCSMEHDSNHENKEIVLRQKIIKKNILDNFDKNLKNISNVKIKIEESIKMVIDDLKSKIELIENLQKQFFESLDIQIKFTNLVYNNYLKKLKDFDLNYFIITNFENQINFNLSELNLNMKDSVENKMSTLINYLKENINNQFKINDNNLKMDNYDDSNIIGVDYKFLKTFNINYTQGFIDLNKSLFGLYNSNSINFFSKESFKQIFEIEEDVLSSIQTCKKSEEDKVIVLTKENLVFIQILENSDYMIIQKKVFLFMHMTSIII